MADVNRGNRPLSPHMSIYRPQVTSVLSIFHRITGTALAVTGLLVVWWFLSAATSPAYFETVDGFLTSWFGGLIMILSAWALWYHFCNGIRHLIWDLGYGFDMDEVTSSAYLVMGVSLILTIVTVFIA